MSENKYDNIRKAKEILRIKQELQERYEEDWRRCQQILPPTNSIQGYLGELDADLEWQNFETRAFQTFLSIDAYDQFIKTDNLILMGRTGTGKSSILNRYVYAVNAGEIKDVDVAISLRIKPLFERLKQYNFSYGTYNNSDYIEECIELVVKLCVMQNFSVTLSGKGEDFDGDLQQISEYLQSRQITEYTDIATYISSKLDQLKGPGSDLREAVNSLKRVYQGVNGPKIEHALKNVLIKNRVLVLVDSLDYYDVTNDRIIIMNKALVEMAFSYFGEYKSQNIMLKVAVPSEVYTHVIEQIPAKRKTKVVAIEWKYKDIIKMLALKIFYFFSTEKYQFAVPFLKDYKIKDFYDYGKAVSFLHKMLPEDCRAAIPMNFETISYCIRHTQKKPRQIVTVFNSFIEKICEEKQFDYFIIHSDEISYYIHRTQSDLINDALNMYNVLAEGKILPIVKNVLTHKRNIMDVTELTNAVKNASDVFRSDDLTVEEVKRILIESGLVGQLYNENYVKENSDLFKNEKVIKICIALFEYQIKDTLAIINGCKYVLHPMCYEYYGNEIDHNLLVYPEPADDKDDNVILTLEEEGFVF